MAKALRKAKQWVKRLREILGIACGATATLVAGLTLVVLATLIHPDDRNYSLPERIVEDVREWWRLMHAEV
jgi:hypothetical protein